MAKLEVLADVLEYIEMHLTEELKTEDIARAVFSSKSTIEKMFREVNHISVHDYVIRRRMTLAAKEIALSNDISIINLAVKYGYGSNEAFTRAFYSVWNCNPSEFRKVNKFTPVYPRLYVPEHQGGGFSMGSNKNVDISELYDLFTKRKECWFVCCDINQMVPINEISRKAGDLAILESLRRMNAVAGEDDIVFRVGGNEFALLTNSTDIAYAEGIRIRIMAMNGQTFDYELQTIPLSLYCGVTKLEKGSVRYKDLFEKLHQTICESKK